MPQDYEIVIGLEAHVHLSTKSKAFCASSTQFGAAPNTCTDPVTLALPGTLPVANRVMVEYGIMLGLATKCEIRRSNRFARKHYFYPDLPKGYQISQFDEPICERGSMTIRTAESSRVIGIKRIHMEEDAGKNIHDPHCGASYLDLNRAGVPLLEVVSEPDLRSPAEAVAYLRTLRQLVRFLGISDGNMEEGSLRCDANISLRPRGEMSFGTRTEIKNINSFRFVEKALEYETVRQIKLLKSGRSVVQETLLFDSQTGTTHPMRDKEESSDYRYFPDPDLPPLRIPESWIEEVRSKMPKLPEQRYHDLMTVYGLNAYDAGVLTAEREYVDYFEEVFNHCSNAKSACNWITTEVFAKLRKQGSNQPQDVVKAAHLGSLIRLIDQEVISGKMAKNVFEEMTSSGRDPKEIVEKQGLKQITSEGDLKTMIVNVLERHSQQVGEYLAGNQRVVGFLVGQVMKASSGSANPKMVNQLLQKELDLIKQKNKDS
ncbi:MAG: Asp-tRNA(Asn)/Glu-tRNA(Gln) amidotransferase subunit GatB [Deltaproteobacteria bacterium]|nr:Asp-tRNA(Asn)/Glu-tRNA(Gln) amidotransferase subunit GatB [Deltaproteobacteria bacterium]